MTEIDKDNLTEIDKDELIADPSVLKAFNDDIVTKFRANGGKEVPGFGDMLLLLTTMGAKSGQPRLSPNSGTLPSLARNFVTMSSLNACRAAASVSRLSVSMSVMPQSKRLGLASIPDILFCSETWLRSDHPGQYHQ